jgi:hypothetical protein
MIIFATGLALSIAAQGAAPEWIVQDPLPGFFVDFREEGSDGMIVEQVPDGESVERWTRMVTVQRFGGAAQRLSPQALLGNMVDGLATSCRGARTSPIEAVMVTGRPAARFRADCPNNPVTGLPETFVALAIAGAADLHVVQVAFRRVPSAADSAWAARQIDSVVLCHGDDDAALCAPGDK